MKNLFKRYEEACIIRNRYYTTLRRNNMVKNVEVRAPNYVKRAEDLKKEYNSIRLFWMEKL